MQLPRNAIENVVARWRNVASACRRRSLKLREWLRLIRVPQYTKNVLVFVPLVASHNFSSAAFTTGSIAFLAFCACASGVYVSNDVVDVEADRLHPKKRLRPLAARSVPVYEALIAAPLLLLLGLALGALISWTFVALLGAYIVLSTAYTLWLKRKVFLDVVVLAILYSVRILGGAEAIGVTTSPWLLAFSIFIFTGLALIKRYAELAMRNDRAVDDPMNRAYEREDLDLLGAMAAAAGFTAATLFALYISSDAVGPLYSRPWMLWLILPLLLYGFCRMLILARHRVLDDDPIVFAFKDRTSLQIITLIVLIVLAAL